MHFKDASTLLVLAAGFTSVAQASLLNVPHRPLVRSTRLLPRQNNGGNNNGGNNNNNNNNGGNNNNNGGNNNALTLLANAVQTGSQSTGQQGVITAGQVESATDNANFINFCSGKTLTNGLQNRGGSCNGIVMGEIPAANKMISAIVLNPKHNDVITEFQTFDVEVQISNLQAGAFTNAQTTYYTAPQKLNGAGNIIGHCHITCQDLGANLNPTNPPNPEIFAFFKGVNDAGNGNGLLKATVTGGLKASNYRCCTMIAASNHQPVMMPVAQRGAQDDCVKFTVGAANNGGNNGGNNAGNNGGNNGGNNAGNNGGNNGANGGNNGANNGGNNGANNGGNNGGNNQGGNNNGGNNNGGNQANPNVDPAGVDPASVDPTTAPNTSVPSQTSNPTVPSVTSSSNVTGVSSSIPTKTSAPSTTKNVLVPSATSKSAAPASTTAKSMGGKRHGRGRGRGKGRVGGRRHKNRNRL